MAFKKNTAVTGFPFMLLAVADLSPITSGAVTGYYTLDGGAQVAIADDVNAFHAGNGAWSMDLSAAEMNGDIVGLMFIHALASTVHFTIKTVTVLVSELNDMAVADLAADFAAIPAAVDAQLSLDSDFAAIPAAVDAQLSLDSDFAAIPAAVDVELSSPHGAGSWLTGSGSGSAMGIGADLCTMTLKTLTDVPFPDADVWITSDAGGATVVAGTRQTDSNGTVQLLLDDLSTYYMWAQKDGMKSVMGQYFIAKKD